MSKIKEARQAIERLNKRGYIVANVKSAQIKNCGVREIARAAI